LTQQKIHLPQQNPNSPDWNIWFFFLPVFFSVVIFTGLLTGYFPEIVRLAWLSRSSVSQPMQRSEEEPMPRSVVYEQNNHLWIASSWGGTPQKLSTPGYIYSRGVPALFTPSGQLVYSGHGVWLTNPFSGHPKRIANLPAGQVITSLALSQDGSQMAWSSAPLSGKGTINLYAGPLESTVLVHQQPANQCPCFRVFSFSQSATSLGNRTLLLTQDDGAHNAVQHGLWLLNLKQGVRAQLQQLMASDPPQGPLALAPDNTHLFYATWEAYVPAPADGSLPDDAVALSYANDLNIATINTQVPQLTSSQVIVGRQPVGEPDTLDSKYHWIMAPYFSPDGSKFAYLAFSSDRSNGLTRHSKIYAVDVKLAGAQVMLGQPQKLISGNSGYSELGGWLDDHRLIVYVNGGLYTYDFLHKQLVKIVSTQGYAQIIGAVARG
jgi:dipeptidyl aminopeptidase/acylaminoacyl peptidase